MKAEEENCQDLVKWYMIILFVPPKSSPKIIEHPFFFQAVPHPSFIQLILSYYTVNFYHPFKPTLNSLYLKV